MTTWRVGHHIPTNIYRDDQPVGHACKAEDAAHIVKVLNAAYKLAAATDHHVADDAVMDIVLEVGQPEPWPTEEADRG